MIETPTIETTMIETTMIETTTIEAVQRFGGPRSLSF
jgi:hypothetical protein